MASMALTGARLSGWERIHFLPETNRIAEFAFGNLAQPLMFFPEDEGQSWSRKPRDSLREWCRRCLLFEWKFPASTARWALTASRTRSMA